ncbi:hypothetical protein ACFL0N_00450 [Pseudomonadota bacterium]
MDDKLRKLFTAFFRQQNKKNHRHQQPENKSAGTDLPGSVARPHISLKARMLGGQAKTIMRLGGSMR